MIGMPSDLRLCDFAITLPREPIDTGTVLIEGRSRNTPQLHSATHQPPQSPPRYAGSGTRIRRTVRGQGLSPPHVRGVKRRTRGGTGDRPGHQARFSNGPRCSRSPYGGRFLENSTVDMRLSGLARPGACPRVPPGPLRAPSHPLGGAAPSRGCRQPCGGAWHTTAARPCGAEAEIVSVGVVTYLRESR